MEDAIEAVRRFNRFYTRRVGALNARFLGTDATLPEARVLFEIANGSRPVAAELQKALDIDPAQLSRTLARFEGRGWVVREAAGEAEDARRRPIALTAAGRAMFDQINARQRAEVAQMLATLAPMQQGDVVAALGSARALLGEAPSRDYAIRTVRTGDLGLLAARQSIFYREAYGWGAGIETNIMESATHFLQHFKPGREQGWIAEVNGAMAGSVLLTDEGEGLARLRLLYVEAMARGRGIGDALVGRCIDFARAAGFREMTLWTHTVLTSARRIYAGRGFRVVETHWHDAFGEMIESETWRLDLT